MSGSTSTHASKEGAKVRKMPILVVPALPAPQALRKSCFQGLGPSRAMRNTSGGAGAAAPGGKLSKLPLCTVGLVYGMIPITA